MLCQECPKKESCVELCQKAEKWVNGDHVSQRELMFSCISEENLNLTIDNLNHHKSIYSHQELVSYFNEPSVNFPFLSDLQNKCLHLFYFQGLTYKQIAYRLSNQYRRVLSHQVKYRIKKAKQLIRAHMFNSEGG